MRFIWNGLGEIPDFLGPHEVEGKNSTSSVAVCLCVNSGPSQTAFLETVNAAEPE